MINLKLKQYDIFLLLGSLFLLSYGLSLWHTEKTPALTLATSVDTAQQAHNILNTLKNTEIIDYLKPFTLSRSVEKIVATMEGLSAQKAAEIARLLITNTPSLQVLDKKELLLGLMLLYKTRQEQELFLNLFLQESKMAEGVPLLVVASQGRLQKAIPTILQWQKQVVSSASAVPDFIKNLVANAFKHAVATNDLDLFTKLKNAGLTLEQSFANELLFDVVKENKNNQFVAALVAMGANVNAVLDKKTPLIIATLGNNINLVNVLLAAGADVNQIPDDATGSALQNALVLKYVDVELLLREHGARE